MNPKVALLSFVVVLIAGLAFFLMPEGDAGLLAPTAGPPGLSGSTSDADIAVEDSPATPSAPDRTLASVAPPIIVNRSDDSTLEGGFVRVELSGSASSRIADIGLGSDFSPEASASALDTLIKGGGVALFAYSGERKLAVEPARIAPDVSLPVVLTEVPAATGLLRVVDKAEGSDLSSFDILTTSIPIRPDLAIRSDSRFGWQAAMVEVDSPVHLEGPLPSGSWVFRDGYVPVPLPKVSPWSDMTVVELRRAGSLIVDHSQLEGPAPALLEIESPDWQGAVTQPSGSDSVTLVQLPAGHYELSLLGDDSTAPVELWSGHCSVVAGKPTRVFATSDRTLAARASLSGRVQCSGGLGPFQKRPLVSIYDKTGRQSVKVIDLNQVDDQGESFTFGPVSLAPGPYRIALTGLSYGQSLELAAGQSEVIDWVVPGMAAVRFEFVDDLTGERLSPQAISYWQDPTGLAPLEGRGARLKAIGFPSRRLVELPAGPTWFRFGSSLGRPVRTERRELIPGEQTVTLHVGGSPTIDLVLNTLEGLDIEDVDLPTFIWARRVGSGGSSPLGPTPWISIRVTPAGPSPSGPGILLQAPLPVDGRWEILLPPMAKVLQPPPATIDTDSPDAPVVLDLLPAGTAPTTGTDPTAED